MTRDITASDSPTPIHNANDNSQNKNRSSSSVVADSEPLPSSALQPSTLTPALAPAAAAFPEPRPIISRRIDTRLMVLNYSEDATAQASDGTTAPLTRPSPLLPPPRPPMAVVPGSEPIGAGPLPPLPPAMLLPPLMLASGIGITPPRCYNMSKKSEYFILSV